uniref:Uncharacterized protein n=1 Tax=Acrobeloides nanus TaxID=290746 RepID=A0A914CYH4_9BILA
MLRDFLTDYKDGLVSSLQGFLVLHKLNQPVQNGIHHKPSALRRVFQVCETYVGNGWQHKWAHVASAALAYRHIRGNLAPVHISLAISDFIHSIVIEIVFLLQAMLIWSLPFQVLAPLVGFTYMSLLYSLYSFEYKWMSSGIPMSSRIARIPMIAQVKSRISRIDKVERRWPFYVGFGTILTLSTSYSEDFMINGCIFGALFPFFIVSSYLATKRDAQSEVPAFRFFYVVQVITNKLFLALVFIINRR